MKSAKISEISRKQKIKVKFAYNKTCKSKRMGNKSAGMRIGGNGTLKTAHLLSGEGLDVVVAEGIKNPGKERSVAQYLSNRIFDLTGLETRETEAV